VNDTHDEILQPTAADRRNAVLTVALGAVVGMALILWGRPALLPLFEHASPAEVIKRVQIFFWLTAVLVGGVACWAFITGARVLKAGRFPLPGARVTRPTRVRRGTRARRLGYVLVACGVAGVVLAANLASFTARLPHALP